jgi:HK97 family phage prohead protease
MWYNPENNTGVLSMKDTVFKAGHQSSADPFDFVLSDESVDRMGDVIRADGWDLDSFRKSPVALYGHNHDIPPIGVWENVRVEGKRLLGTLRPAKSGTSEFIDTIRSLIEQRILRAVSVGFQPLEAESRKSGGGFDFIKSQLHEVSVVAVGANPNALAIAKALSPEVADKLFVQLDPPAGEDRTGQSTHETSTPNLDAARARLKAMGID